jgi:L-serine dehydratase
MAAHALAAVDLTLSGISSIIPFDEVIWAMKQIGDAMSPIIKETSRGGLALTPAGLSYRARPDDPAT